MEQAGEKLRRARERLKLTYRDVAKASKEIARRRSSTEFAIPLSRLADIENNGRLPSMFRLYTLCAIYRLNLHEVLRWYGVPVESLATESLRIGLSETHPLEITPDGQASIPHFLESGVNPEKTTFLSHMIRRWGKIPLSFINGMDPGQHRYALLGLEDWSMFPILRPGSLLWIDEGRRRIARRGWTNEFDRPIYFLEHRGGFLCGWCTLDGERLIVQAHPASEKPPAVFQHDVEIDVLGQVVGVAMLLDPEKSSSSSDTQVTS
jgi:transcriptional regulator with XRE-family HTH domain